MGIAAIVNTHLSCVRNDIFCLANQKFEWIWPNNVAAIQQIAEKTLAFTEARFATCPHLLQPLQHDINKELKAVDQLKMTFERLKNQFGIKDAEEEGQWLTQKQWESFNQIMQTIEKLPYFGKEDFNRMFEAVPIDGPKNTNQVKKAFQQEIVRRWQQQWRNASERLTMLKKEQESIAGSCTKIDQLHQHYTSLADLFTSCSSNFSDCILNDSGKRTKALDMMASAIAEILPKTAEESRDMRIQDCFSSADCPAIGKAKDHQKNPKSASIKDCFSPANCADIDKDKVHERERKAAETAYTTKAPKNKREELNNWFASKFIAPEWQDIQEVLRFRSDDPREKFLFIVADHDHNGALDASNIAGMLSQLSQKFDLKFQLVKKHADICESIKSGGKTGNLVHVLIEAHGNPKFMTFDAEQEDVATDWISESDFTYLSKCFSGLQPNGKILLMSCSTGAMKNIGTEENPRYNGLPFDNIAQKMANAAKRVVIAPRNLAHPGLTHFLSIDDGVLFEPEHHSYSFLPFYATNLYSAFRPIFKKCFPDINIETIHQRELSALDVIKTDLISKSLLHKEEPPGRAHEYLQICSDDPRQKTLFFVAEYDKNGAMEPKWTPEILSLFADRFDLQYKVVKSLREICRGIDQAVKGGTIANVVILSHGTTSDGMIFSKDSNDHESGLKASDPFSKCFSGLEKDGTIVLMGSSLGQKGDDKNNIAQKIANDSKRTVLATTCPIFPADTKIKSLNPLMMEHPQYSGMYNFFSMGCPENNENHFKTFTPKNLEQNTQINHKDL